MFFLAARNYCSCSVYSFTQLYMIIIVCFLISNAVSLRFSILYCSSSTCTFLYFELVVSCHQDTDTMFLNFVLDQALKSSLILLWLQFYDLSLLQLILYLVSFWVSHETDALWFVQLKCGCCGEVTKKETCLSLNETVPLPASRGTANLVQKVTLCVCFI